MKVSRNSSTAAESFSATDRGQPTSFSLTDLGGDVDPRTNAARPDLADIALAGKVFAPYFVRPTICRAVVPIADLRETPASDGMLGSQLLLGEAFAVLETDSGWSWGFGLHDHYVGYVEKNALGAGPEPTHMVAVRLAPLLAEPEDEARVIGERPMGLRVTTRVSNGFATIEGGFLRAEHLRALDAPPVHPIEAAEQLLDTPYLWGGRSGAGIDCSGLVQLALSFSGVLAPRDSDMQQPELGRPLAGHEALQRGDLVFFPDHVGMMRDEQNILHAANYWGRVIAEPFAEVVARLGAEHENPVLARKRLDRAPSLV